MDLRQLNTFLQVAELGSVGRASDRLRIAQPALAARCGSWRRNSACLCSRATAAACS